MRQIALFVVTAGIAIVLIRSATRKAKSRAVAAPASAQDEASAENPEDAGAETEDDAPPAPGTERNDAASGRDGRLTDRVQREMFRRTDAPSHTGGSGSG